MRSLIHKSFDKKYNNEKLEFLGDRVIGLSISKNETSGLHLIYTHCRN